jgi:hypothetical protein
MKFITKRNRITITSPLDIHQTIKYGYIYIQHLESDVKRMLLQIQLIYNIEEIEKWNIPSAKLNKPFCFLEAGPRFFMAAENTHS